MVKRGLKLWSINTGAYRDEAVRLYGKGLFEYIELYVLPDSSQTLPLWKELAVPFVIHVPHFAHGFNLANSQKAESNHFIYQQSKLFADELNAHWLIFHGGVDGNIEETARQLKSFCEPGAVIENKPLIALPNRMGGERCVGTTPDEINRIKAETGCGFCLDFGHAVCAANAWGKEPYSFIDQFLKIEPTIFHLTDLKDMDSVYDTHLSLGTGQLNIKYLLKQLPEDAFVTFEMDKESSDNLHDFEKDMLWLTNLS